MKQVWLALFVALFTLPSFAIVDMRNANYSETWVDIDTGSAGFDLKVQRTYNSRTVHNGIFGFGWCSDFETTLAVTAQNTLRLKECGAGLNIEYSRGKAKSEKSVNSLVAEIMVEVKKRNKGQPAAFFTNLFAIEVVEKLQQAGFQALWAGGCVRDQLAGRTPKDYDVATNATPEQVRDVFGKQRTLPIGASFGVITVLGSKKAGPIEVATFRRDGGYSDGRHPDSVEFTDAREDALRRDFTINGMFFDPITETVHDYVGGQEDLALRQIRAIGNPHERIDEDKLRMLRAVRFASTFEFELEPETLSAIQTHAVEINVVSGERIGAELRQMLSGPHRAVAVELLRESGLLAEIVPEGSSLYDKIEDWERTIASLKRVDGDFESAAAILLGPIIVRDGIEVVIERWKLSNLERKSINWICRNWRTLNQADQLAWSTVQPLLLEADAKRGLAVAESYAAQPSPGVVFCRERLAWPIDLLDPKPLLDGGDLINLGIKSGPLFARILGAVRAAQLDGEIDSAKQARKMAKEME